MPLHQVIYVVLLIGCCGYALAAGGPTERWVAIVHLLGTIATAIVLGPFLPRWGLAITFVSIIDAVVLMAFLIVMATSKAYWPIWNFALSADEAMAGLATTLHTNFPPTVYFVSEIHWSKAMLVLLAYATWSRRRSMTPPSSRASSAYR